MEYIAEEEAKEDVGTEELKLDDGLPLATGRIPAARAGPAASPVTG